MLSPPQQVQVPVCTKATTPKPLGCKPGYKRVSGKCYLCSAGTYSSDGKTCRLACVLQDRDMYESPCR